MTATAAWTTTTTVQGTTIVAPNTTVQDDTPNALLSRVVRRVQAKGLYVVGVYGGDWEGTHDGRRTCAGRRRSWWRRRPWATW